MAETQNMVHKEHQEWLEEITYWHNELLYFSNVLIRLLEKTNKPEDEGRIVDFKAQFDEMQSHFEGLKGNILNHENNLERLNGNAEAYAQAHNHVKDEVSIFRSKFRVLKNEFYAFTEKGHWW